MGLNKNKLRFLIVTEDFPKNIKKFPTKLTIQIYDRSTYCDNIDYNFTDWPV